MNTDEKIQEEYFRLALSRLSAFIRGPISEVAFPTAYNRIS